MARIPQSIGKYRILKEIASGSFGRVYLADDTSRGGYPVAIKLMHVAHLTSLHESNSFLQEAQILTLLRHPYIIPVLDLGIEEEIPYLVMEYAPNGSLYDRLQEITPRPLPIEDTLTMLGQVGAALQYAHQQNVIHRDLKPANILFNAQGDALLADFGIATMLSNSIKSGTVVGTPYYMAPERFRGTISKESDQYALGCIAYQAMTGRLPFDSLDFIALGFKHLSETPIPPSQHNRLIPETVEAAILRAMAKERTQRFPDIRSFVEALGGTLPSNDSFLATLPSTGRIASVAQPLRAGGNDATVLPHLHIEERGQSVLSMSGHDSGEGLTAFSNLVETPAQAEVSHILLSNESPGVRTPTLSAKEWNNYGRDEQEDVPTLLSVGSTSSLGAEEMKTLPAGSPIPIDPQWPNSKPGQHKKWWHIRPVLIAVVITLLVALIGGGVLYAMKGVIPRSPSLQTLTAQVNITPQQTLLDKTYTISAILGTPNASKQQVQARSISSTSTTQSITVSATGHGSTSATNGRGYITMHNLQSNEGIYYYANSSSSYFTVNGHTVYLSQSGFLPAGSTASIPAYATPAGSGSNLAAGTVNGTYPCGSVSNCAADYNSAFSGGSDVSSYIYVLQSDVNNANNQVVNQYEAGETTISKSNVEGQVSSNEQLLKGIGCVQQLSDNQSAGNHASSITAFLSMSCSAEVYAPNSAQSLTASLLQNSITSTPGEKLIGKISTHVLSVSGVANGTIILQIEAKGTEVYTFSATQLQLMKASIMGKSLQEAQAILNKQPGVSNATVILSSADEKTIPKDMKDITMVLLK